VLTTLASLKSENAPLGLARVLLVHGDVASRLTLQTLLQAGGYMVDVAASSAEARLKLDEQKYELVLCDTATESTESGLGVLAYARSKEYRPATAAVTAYHKSRPRRGEPRGRQRVSVDTDQLSKLLGKVADLIGARATRRAERAMRHAGVF
jgi:CheY-like chemotaxis protein